MEDWVLLGALAALIALVAYGALSRRGQDASAGETLGSLQTSQAELAGRMAQMAEANNLAQTALTKSLNERLDTLGATMIQSQNKVQLEFTKSLNERLDALGKRVGDNLTESAEKASQTMTDLQKRLAVIDQAQKNLTDLSGQVVSLQDILANKQARGAFGEIQLNDLVRNALPPSAYSFQATLGNGKRADCLIEMPNPPGSIVIDSKFPLESYRALRDARDEAAHAAAARTFTADIKKHVTDIAARYIVPGETAESAIMFLPSEAVYAELYTSFQHVVDFSHKARVWIVSPTTLMATLTTVRAVLKDARMREQAHVIQKQVLTLVEDVGRLEKRTENLRRHFASAEKDVREIETSAGKIVRRAERIEEVQLGEETAETEGLPTGDGPQGSSVASLLPRK